MGYGSGVRVPVAREYGYAPYFETALPPGILPSPELNQNFIQVISFQLDRSVERNENAVKLHAEEGREKAERAEEKNKRNWLEMAKGDWDSSTGAFGNVGAPGSRGGFMSFMNPETGPDSPAERRSESAA
jgi:hypothetical protein